MERTYEPVPDSDADVVGLIAYSILAAMTRLAKDKWTRRFDFRGEGRACAHGHSSFSIPIPQKLKHRGIGLAEK